MRINLDSQSTPAFLQKTHYSSLDGFRAISIIAVVYAHFYFNENNALARFFSGEWGVHFFFVISGFLITSLLLKEKSKKGTIELKKFYIRRFLRIFPVAYLFLIVLFILNLIFCIKIGWESFVSSFLYIRNLPILPSGDWYTGHYWSLSVEEQFYLFVPWLLRKRIKLFVFVALLFLFVSPVISYFYFHGYSEVYFILFLKQLIVNQAPIIIGSLFAILTHFKILRLTKLSGFICLLLIFFSMIIMSNIIPIIPSAITPLISSSIIGLVIIASIQHEKGWYYWLLNNWLMVKIGILSYSIYIWQQLFTHSQIWSYNGKVWSSATFNLFMLFVVSILSYYLYERWFLKLKDKFV